MRTMESRLLLGDVFDFHAARGGGNNHDAFGFAVEHETQIEFAGDGDAAFDVETVDDFACGARLVRDQLLSEQLVGGVGDFILIATEFHAAGLAATTRMNLGFDHPELAADFAGAVGRLFGAVGQCALGDWHAKFCENFLGLILVNVHGQAAFLRAASAPVSR